MNRDTGGSKSQRRRQRLIAALLNQPNLEKAVADAGISLSTAFRIRQTPEFQAEYLQARRDLVSQAGARLQQSCGAAISVVLQVMVDRACKPGDRVRASTQVLEHARRLLESEDQEIRLQSLERKLAEFLSKAQSF